MRYITKAAFVCILMITTAPMVQAGDKEQRRAEMLEQFDTDGDGQLSEAERQAARESGAFAGGRGRGEQRRQQILEEFDADGDGQLSESERQAARESGKFGRRGKRSGGNGG